MIFFNWLKKIWYLFIYRFKKLDLDVLQARLTGDTSFIDIRYIISRPDKLKQNIPIYLIDESNGQRIHLMKLSRYGTIKTKHTKYQSKGVLLFINRNNIIKPHSKVTLVYGDINKHNIEVY